VKSRIISNLKQNRNIYGLLISVLFIIGIAELYRTYSLEKTKNTFAVFVGYKGGVGNANKFFSYFNEIENLKIETFTSYHNEELEISDTVWIKYSIKDPNVIEVVDIDYKKYIKNQK
jgi:hypothetical protein